jgi:hypothetical protein
MAGKSTNQIIPLLIAAAVFAAGTMWSHSVAAEGALAVGLPSDVAKEGYASGYSYNAKTMDDARRVAMDYCHKSPTNQKVRSLCKVIQTFSNRCVAVSLDPKAGTPGAGWGIGDDLRAAEGQALSRCAATANRHVVRRAW